MGEKLLLLSNWGDVYPTRIIIIYIIRIKGLFIVASTVIIMIAMLPLLTCFMLLVLRAFKVNLLSYSKLYKKKKIRKGSKWYNCPCMFGLWYNMPWWLFCQVLLFGFAINSYSFILFHNTPTHLSLSLNFF